MLALNDQINTVKPGTIITVRNGLAKVLKETGRIKLIIDKWGKIEAAAADVSAARPRQALWTPPQAWASVVNDVAVLDDLRKAPGIGLGQRAELSR
jgi:hypothetical protein